MEHVDTYAIHSNCIWRKQSVIALQQLEDLKQNGWITVEGHITCQWQTRIIWLLLSHGKHDWNS